jgi:hypothetical protein
MQPRLLVVIDTEEDWFDDTARPVSVANIDALPGFQARWFDPLGVKPVYLVNYPVASGERSSAILRELAASGVCEIGVHVHNWTSPPFTAEDVKQRTYHTDIDRGVEKQKIADVVRLVRERIGVAPRAFKGGRWGCDGRTVRSLEELGLDIDTSVCPLTDYRGEGGGPNFFDAPWLPYFPSYEDILVPRQVRDPRGALLELPVTIGFTSGENEQRRELFRRLRDGGWTSRMHLIGVLHRLGVLRRVKLSQESADGAQMRQLADATLARGYPLLHMTFHSNITAVGTSPYSMTERERDQRSAWMGELLAYSVRDKGVRPATASEFRAGWLESQAAGARS